MCVGWVLLTTGGPRTVSIRTSMDGSEWSGDWGCAIPSRTSKVNPAIRTHCATYNESAIIRPDPQEDPPEMQFYRVRPFYLAESVRRQIYMVSLRWYLDQVGCIADCNMTERPLFAEQGRLAAHALQYAASPAEVNNVSTYGYWGPYCPKVGGGFQMCHKGHGYGKMHGALLRFSFRPLCVHSDEYGLCSPS